MRGLILSAVAALASLASPASAYQAYTQGPTISTTTGIIVRTDAGIFKFSSSSQTISTPTIVLNGQAFSVFVGSANANPSYIASVVAQSSQTVSTSTIQAWLSNGGSLLAAMYQSGLFSVTGTAAISSGLTASSGTFTATGATQFSLVTSSGINVTSPGQVYAPWFVGNLQGNAASASGAPPTGAASGDLGGTYPSPTVTGLTHAAGALAAGVTIPWADNFCSTCAAVNLDNNFSTPETFIGSVTVNGTGGLKTSTITATGIVASSGSFTNGVTASSFTATITGNTQFSVATSSGINVLNSAGVYAGFFVGNGIGLTNVIPAGSAGGDLTGTYPNPSVLQASNAGGFTMKTPATFTSSATFTGVNVKHSSGTLLIDGTGSIPFEVGASTLIVTNGQVGINVSVPCSTCTSFHFKGNGSVVGQIQVSTLKFDDGSTQTSASAAGGDTGVSSTTSHAFSGSTTQTTLGPYTIPGSTLAIVMIGNNPVGIFLTGEGCDGLADGVNLTPLLTNVSAHAAFLYQANNGTGTCGFQEPVANQPGSISAPFLTPAQTAGDTVTITLALRTINGGTATVGSGCGISDGLHMTIKEMK